ncbi:IS1380 family transposase [bacterium]|nr:IS1380 family transposase [bacterium]
MLSMAKTDFDDIEQFREDDFFAKTLNLSKGVAPSSPTLRLRLNAATDMWDKAILEANTYLLKEYAKITPCPEGFVRLDYDVSPFDNSGSKKEGVSMTYKMKDGFAPMFVYMGQEGHMINLEFREGKCHCQNGTPEFIRETIRIAKKIDNRSLLSVFDSGNDSIDNVVECRAEGSDFIIKRNLRKESTDDWLEIAQDFGTAHEVRPGKVEYIGSVLVSHEKLDDPIRIAFRVIKRTIDRKGQHLLVADIEVETYWTSLELSPLTIIDLYHAHGTSEQFHSEFKGDMDLERLPSGHFSTNTRIMYLGLITYNILRLIGQGSLEYDVYNSRRKKVFRRRLRSVIQDIIYLASRLVKKANRYWISFGRHCPYYDVFKGLYGRWAT